MKILLVNKYFYKKGGCETYYLALGEILKAEGHEVIWFSMKHPKNEFCAQDQYFVDYVDFNEPMNFFKKAKTALSIIYSRKNKRKFEKLLEMERPDIVHINNIHKQITLSFLDSCLEHNLPVVATSHDWIYICPNYQKLSDGVICEKCHYGDIWNCFKSQCVQGSRIRSMLAALESWFLKRTRAYEKINLFIAPSICMVEKMRDAKFTNSDIIYMRNFLPELNLHLREPSSSPYFLYMGRISREKGIRTLIKAYGIANINADLYILGDGPIMEEIKAEVSGSNMEGSVHIPGSKYGDELVDYVAGSLAVVVPSEWLENCPYSVMEALAMGKPVIGSRIGGIPELIEDGVTGYCYEAGDAEDLARKLEALSRLPPDEYKKMSRAAAEFAKKNFDGKIYSAELLHKYEMLISQKGLPKW